MISQSAHAKTQTYFHSSVFFWASRIACTSFACLQMSLEFVLAWPDYSKETCEEQEVEMEWDGHHSCESKTISWRLGGRDAQRLATMPFISACFSLQQQCGCAIDFESLGIRHRQNRQFNLDASDNLCETGIVFRFHRLHWRLLRVWNLVQVWPDLSKGTCEEQEVEMDIIWKQDIISWRLGGRDAQRLATMPFISACFSLQQQCGCAIDFESLGIRHRQKRQFNLDASDNLCETGIFSVFIGCTDGCSECATWFKYDQIFQKENVKSMKWRWTSYANKI